METLTTEKKKAYQWHKVNKQQKTQDYNRTESILILFSRTGNFFRKTFTVELFFFLLYLHQWTRRQAMRTGKALQEVSGHNCDWTEDRKKAWTATSKLQSSAYL